MTALDVQKRLIEVFKADAALMAIVTEIYDFPPDTPVFPFMSVGDIRSTPLDTKSGYGMVHVVNVNVWGRVSRAQCRQVLDRVMVLLHDASIDLDVGRMLPRLVTEQTLVEPDKQTFRGMGQYQIEVHAIT